MSVVTLKGRSVSVTAFPDTEAESVRSVTLVGELSVKSEEFRHWWADHNVRDKTYGRKELDHPLVGELTLDFESLRLPGDQDQVLVTYTAEAGSASAERLALLASWGAAVPAS